METQTIYETKKTTTHLVYDYIVQFKSEHDGISPTYREIMDAVDGIGSISVVDYHLTKLEDDGLIKRLERKQGHIMVTGAHWIAPGEYAWLYMGTGL